MYYQLNDILKRLNDIEQTKNCFFAAVLTPEDWQRQKEPLGFPDYTGFEHYSIYNCKAEVYAKYVFGSIVVPDKHHVSGTPYKLLYYINENGIVIIDDSTLSNEIIGRIVQKYQNQPMTPELFFYNFLSDFLEADLDLLESYENRLFSMEENALSGNIDHILPRLLKIRRILGRIRYYYEQLSDMAQVLETDEKHYFNPDEVSYFHQFSDRVNRLKDMTQQSIEYCQTLREVYQTELDHIQNKNMQFLTVITTIFLPLTVITGWYGMNFENMPEIESRWGYLVVILISIAVIIGEIIYLKKKKML